MASDETAYGIGYEVSSGNLFASDSSSEHPASHSPWIAEHKKETVRNPVEQAAAIEAAQARARLVLEKFKRQRSILQAKPADSALIGVEFDRRQKWLLREKQRIKISLLRNLDRLLARDKANLASLDSKVANATVLEQEATKSYEALLETRRQRLLGSSGNTCRQKGGAPRHVSASTTKNTQNSGAALYISGVDESDNEEMLRKLFGAFGNLKRIHFYRDKATNAFKGDGLVIYEVTDSDRPHVLLENVCGQLNGSELPRGNILKVEISRTNTFFTNESSVTTEPAQAASTTRSNHEVGVDDSELDDFFDSI